MLVLIVIQMRAQHKRDVKDVNVAVDYLPNQQISPTFTKCDANIWYQKLSIAFPKHDKLLEGIPSTQGKLATGLELLTHRISILWRNAMMFGLVMGRSIRYED